MKKTLFLAASLCCAALLGCESQPQVYNPAVGEGYYILTPKASDAPRINGAEIFGVRPGSPFFHTITASGLKPMTFAAENLPAGLKINPKTGTITGKIKDKKEQTYTVSLTATNSAGEAKENFEIVVGEDIVLTPPMGWSSWIATKKILSQDQVLKNARAMKKLGLQDYGYSYVNIDDCWQGNVRGGKFKGIQPDLKKFPDIKKLSNQIHGMGFKFGIYSTPWITSYAKYIGGSSNNKAGKWDTSMIANKTQLNVEGRASLLGKYKFDENDAKQWAEWKVDYMKYDWNPNDSTSIINMAKALRNSGRDIAFSISNSCPMYLGGLVSECVQVARTNGDIRARWNTDESNHINLRDNWEHHNKWLEEGFEGGPGHTPDADYLMVGLQKYGADNDLTPDQLYHHFSSYILWGTPLLLSYQLENMTDFEKALLTNCEMIDINQDKLSKPGRLKMVDNGIEVIVKELSNGDKAIGIFSFNDTATEATINFEQLGLSAKQSLRDVWRGENIGTYKGEFKAVVQPCGVIVVRATSL